MKHVPKQSARQSEAGFTLTEMMMVLALMGIISGVIATAFSVSVRASDRIEAALPPARDANSLNFWLASDISSAVPVWLDPLAAPPVVDPNWITTDASPATSTGCGASSADFPAAVNVLRIKTRNPIKPVNPETYVASYRYNSVTRELWRVFCQTGFPPSSVSVLASDIDPAFTPLGTIDPTLTAHLTKRWAKISFGVIYRNVATKVVATAAVRVPELQPLVGPGTVGGGPTRPNCAYSAAVFSPSPVSQAAAPPGNNRPLATDVQITLTTNESAGAICESILVPPVAGTGLIAMASTNGNLECPLVKSGPSVWTAATCPIWKIRPWKVPGPAGSIANFPITFVSRTDPTDLSTDLILLGTGSPALSVLQGP
jgi:prepilin-type N-terminal cleavage/methylation domain-containing protein